MKKLINKFIVWYLLRYCNAVMRYDGKVVRVYSQEFYNAAILGGIIEMARKRAREKEKQK